MRQLGFAGTIAVVGNEPEIPYERPPLSKEYFAGDKSFDRILVRPATFWAERNVEMILNTEVTAVDAAAEKRLTFANGGSLDYGTLIRRGKSTGRLRRLC